MAGIRSNGPLALFGNTSYPDKCSYGLVTLVILIVFGEGDFCIQAYLSFIHHKTPKNSMQHKGYISKLIGHWKEF